jgi:predicted acylesterase/phospholipase RssA
LAAGVPLEKIIDLYATEGKSIFTDPMPDQSQLLSLLRWLGRNVNKAANSADHLRSVLDRLFGQETMGELYSRRGIALCITSVDLLKETARVFKTGHVGNKVMDDGHRITDVCLASAAAPVFLPLAEIESSSVFVDGGLWANNPIMVALVEALELAAERDIEIISIGTCPAPAGTVISKSELNRGLWGWLFNTKTLSVSMNAQAHGNNNIAKLLQPHLSKNGRSVTIARLPQTAPSLDHSKYLKLDQATDKAIRAFQQLGQADAIATYQLCQNGSQEGRLVKTVFEQILERQEANTYV